MILLLSLPYSLSFSPCCFLLSHQTSPSLSVSCCLLSHIHIYRIAHHTFIYQSCLTDISTIITILLFFTIAALIFVSPLTLSWTLFSFPSPLVFQLPQILTLGNTLQCIIKSKSVQPAYIVMLNIEIGKAVPLNVYVWDNWENLSCKTSYFGNKPINYLQASAEQEKLNLLLS